MRRLHPVRECAARRGIVSRGALLLALVPALLGGAGCDGGSPVARTSTVDASSTPASRRSCERRSIVLISLDTTRADRLGCYGRGSAATPNIDDWAGKGVAFDRAFTPVPVTLPAHAALLTGLLPHRHGVRDNGIYRLPDDVPTVTEALAAVGYDTAAVVAAAVLDRQYGLGRGFRVYDDDVRGGGLAIPERDAAAVTDRALEIADGLTHPFFLLVHYFDPHIDYRPPQRFAARFAGSPYDGEIAFVDEQLGRLRDGLARRGLLDETIVVLAADHGESLGEHGEPTHGVFLYQPTVRIPLIVVAPGCWPEGTRVDSPASLVDVAPTLLELTGHAPLPGLDGRSLAAAARGERVPPRQLVLESELGFNSYGWAPLIGLTDGSFKWIGAPEPELYDLVRDPGEAENLATSRPNDRDRLAAAWRGIVNDDRRSLALADDPAAVAERLAALRSLGYVSATERSGTSDADRPDPKRAIGDLADINAARELLSRGRPDQAADRLAPLAERAPENLSALILLGSARILAGRPAEAIDPLERAAALSPSNADVLFNLGLARISVGDVAGAEAAWRGALELTPRFHDAAANLVDLLIGSARLDDAALVLTQVRNDGLGGPVLDFLDGKLAAARGDGDRARAALDRALAGQLPPALAAEARAISRSLGPAH